MEKKKLNNFSNEQLVSSYIEYVNQVRLSDYLIALDTILVRETNQLSEISMRSEAAIAQIEIAGQEIQNLIKINRGGRTGLHGFLAEVAETGIRNSRDVFQGLKKSTSLLNNNGPTDLLINDQEIQMKFYSNLLKEVKQASKYDKIVMIPKNHIDVINQIMSGEKSVELEGNRLSIAKINNIKNEIEKESIRRGLDYKVWLKESVLDYKDVQQGNIQSTLSREVNSIKNKTIKEKAIVKKDADNHREVAYQKSRPGFREATKSAVAGALFQGGMSLAFFILQKHREGKEVWEFDFDDWNECGLVSGSEALKGGVSGFAIYGLSNFCKISAPAAGAIVSSMYGISSSIIKYRMAEIDEEEFKSLILLNSIDTAVSTLGSIVGQTAIPIPVVGSLIGSILATTALNLGGELFNQSERNLILGYQKELEIYVKNLNIELQNEIAEINQKYKVIGDLQSYSFDENVNITLRFVTSIDLAEIVGVPEDEILTNLNEIDQYFLS